MNDDLDRQLREAGVVVEINYGRTWYVVPDRSTGYADPMAALRHVAERRRRSTVDMVHVGRERPEPPE